MDNVQALKIVVEILRHIKDVEIDVKNRSFKAAMAFSEALKGAEVTPSAELLLALQHQDIMSQQLSATIDAINAIDSSVSLWLHTYQSDSGLLQDGLLRLNDKLKFSLEEAKQKKAAFLGKDEGSQDEIEFF